MKCPQPNTFIIYFILLQTINPEQFVAHSLSKILNIEDIEPCRWDALFTGRHRAYGVEKRHARRAGLTQWQCPIGQRDELYRSM